MNYFERRRRDERIRKACLITLGVTGALAFLGSLYLNLQALGILPQ